MLTNEEYDALTPNSAAKILQDHLEYRRLVIDARSIPIVARCFMVDYKAFIKSIDWICNNADNQIKMYPDGRIDELSFGLLWYHRPRAYGYEDTKPPEFIAYRDVPEDAKCFMNGGLIYRGPERGADYPQKHHDWSVHT